MTKPAGAIVTYFPDTGFADRLAAIARAVSPLVVVDNSVDADVQRQLAGLCNAAGADLIVNSTNAGIGAALNRAFADFAARGIEWCVAFDQDSTPEPGFASALLTMATEHEAAVVGANWRDAARPDFAARHLSRGALPGWFARRVATTDLENVTCVITSGSVFHLPTWREIGGFDEGLFLDLVDTDYCLRARAAGHRVCVAAAARMSHRRGAKQRVVFGGRNFWPAHMPPNRLQLLFRNRLHLFRRHAWGAPHWVAFELAYAAKIIVEVVLLEDQKRAKLAACLRGTWEGLRGRSGPVLSPRKKASAHVRVP